MFSTAHRSRINTFCYGDMVYFSAEEKNDYITRFLWFFFLHIALSKLSNMAILELLACGWWWQWSSPFCPHAPSRHLCHSFLLVRLFTRAAGFGLGFFSYSHRHISLGNRLFSMYRHVKTSNTHVHIINHINHATDKGRSVLPTPTPSVGQS